MDIWKHKTRNFRSIEAKVLWVAPRIYYKMSEYFWIEKFMLIRIALHNIRKSNNLHDIPFVGDVKFSDIVKSTILDAQ